jgi:hypothetical protein
MYIPPDWIEHKSNEPKINEIFAILEMDCVDDDLLKEKENKTEELKAMGEDILYDKIKNREISF